VLFVTHDIDEAVFMGSRVFVMSARPGRIKLDRAVPIAHPRHYSVKTTAGFSEIDLVGVQPRTDHLLTQRKGTATKQDPHPARRSTRTALVPPKANELDSITCAAKPSRAVLET
jgi:ABC-type proline/glycine betaine transport system ATPase subunit